LPTTRRAALALAALLASAPLTARAATVWTALASEKIRADAGARSDRAATLAAAKNEFEAFQVVVTGPARQVSAQMSALSGDGAASIGGAKLYREDLLNVTTPSAVDGALGRIPDALVPDVDDVVGEQRNAFPFDVAAGESRAIWIEVHVPPDAAAGSYRGVATIRADGTDTPVPVTLTVWDFALPSTASLKSAFALTYGGLLGPHHLAGGTEALTELRQKYAQLALDHRITISDIWDDGQQGDWSHVDNAYGPFLDGNASTQLRGAKLTSFQSGAGLTNIGDLANWASHAKAKGWFDRLFQYTCDEPPITCAWGDVWTRSNAAKQADPDFRTLVTTDIDQAQGNGIAGAVDLMTPVVNFMEDRLWENGQPGAGGEAYPTYAGFLGSGKEKELWLYQSCMSHGCGGTVDIGNPTAADQYWTGWPTYVVDSNAVRSRAMEWLSFRYGATGELYYETVQAYYDKDPWSDLFEFNGNGDGTLFFPGTVARIGGSTDIPVASIRLKMIREGMEDYEYPKLLSDLGGAADAKQIAEQLFPHAWATDQRPEDLMAAREVLARKILALAGKSSPPAVISAASGASVPATTNASAGSAGAVASGCGSTGHGAGLLALLLVAAALLARRARRPHLA